MHTLKRTTCLILSLLMLLTSSSILHANVTQPDDSQYLQITKTDARDIYEDSMSMCAEIEALNASLTSERAATRELIFAVNKNKETTAELITTYEQLKIQQDLQIKKLKKTNTATKTLCIIISALAIAGGVAIASH